MLTFSYAYLFFSQLTNRLKPALKRIQNLAVIILLLHLAAEFPTETTTNMFLQSG